ncbi:glycosyltransferase family 2 protein [Clavibacter sp. Sh2036]|uniref:glycosyltransferase family 2 protein n=2 Tax=unclassified Clavibacter TaxID=2626594 RepID=UPI0039E0F57F
MSSDAVADPRRTDAEGAGAAGDAAAADAAAEDADGPTADGLPTLVVAVLTYRRPRDIRALLPMLVDEARGAAGATSAARIVVVDNDPDAGARDVVAEAAAQAASAGVDVAYAHEPEPGISAGRNRALDAAPHDDLLVFIDDDERPAPGWLDALLALQRETGCAAVAGPVESRFEVEPDAWIRAGRFFERRRPATGTVLEVAATNNILLDLRRVRAWGLRFDTGFGATGGEDTLFTRAVVAHGGRMLWAADARVLDIVPRARVTHRWVVLRAMSSGNSWSRTTLALAGSGRERAVARATLTARGAVRIAGGLAGVAAGAAAGVAGAGLGRRARGVRTLARGAGIVSGAWGHAHREYARPSA